MYERAEPFSGLILALHLCVCVQSTLWSVSQGIPREILSISDLNPGILLNVNAPVCALSASVYVFRKSQKELISHPFVFKRLSNLSFFFF